MSDEINVIVVDHGRKYLYLRYTNPITGERVEKSSGETSERAARKRASEWQAELNAGGGKRVTAKWADFTEAYESRPWLSGHPLTTCGGHSVPDGPGGSIR